MTESRAGARVLRAPVPDERPLPDRTLGRSLSLSMWLGSSQIGPLPHFRRAAISAIKFIANAFFLSSSGERTAQSVCSVFPK